MRLPLQLIFAAAISVGVGWSGARWIAGSGPIRGKAAVGMPDERAALDPATNASASTGSAGAKERIAALATISDQPASLARDHALAAALQKLEAADFPAGASEMLALLGRLETSQQTQAEDLAEAWMDRWLAVDAPGALRFLGSAPFLGELHAKDWRGWPLEQRLHGGFGGVFKVLARREPEWTRQALAAMKPGTDRETGLYALMNEAAARDLAKAKQFLASFPDAGDRRAVFTGYVAGMVNTDVRSGFDVAWAEKPGQLREELLGNVFGAAGRRGASQVREVLDRIDDPATRRRLAATALNNLGFLKPEDALPLFREESERMVVVDGRKAEFGREWVYPMQGIVRSPLAPALAEWAAGFAPDADREMFGMAVRIWADMGAEEFQSWLSDHADALDAKASEKIGPALVSLARRDLAAMRAWSETLPPGALRDQARFQVALNSGAEVNFAQAAAAYQALAASDTKGALASQLAGVLARQDGASAAEWAMRQPPGPARTAALTTVANTWSGRDPAGAARWLEAMPAGAERDRAVGAYATIVTVADPAAAAQWVEQVADPALRAQTADTVFLRWSMENPPAARAWLRSLPGLGRSTVADIMHRTR